MKKSIGATFPAALPLLAKIANAKFCGCAAIFFLVAVLTLSFSACRTLSTQNADPQSGVITGMLYYLPIGKITIKGQFKDVEKKEESAKPCQSCTPCAKPIATEEMEKLAPTAGRGRRGTGGEGEEGDGAPGPDSISVSQLTVTLSPEEKADESAGAFYATPHANYWYEDEVKLGVNPKHLLSTGNVTTEDKTAEIVGTLASIAAQIPKIAATPAPGESPTPPPKKLSRQPFHFSFHPSIPSEVRDVANELEARGIGFKVESSPASNDKTVFPSSDEIKRLGDRGLVFRPAMSYKVTLIFNADRDPKTTDTGHLIKSTQQYVMPDPSRLYVMEYSRMAFVKKVKEAGFKDGMLTDFHQKVPSPILGFLGIPKAVLQAIVPIPGAHPQNGSASGSGTTPPKS